MVENSTQVGATVTCCSLFSGDAGSLVWKFLVQPNLIPGPQQFRSSPFHITGFAPGLFSCRDGWLKPCTEFFFPRCLQARNYSHSLQSYGDALSAMADLGFCEHWRPQPESSISFGFLFKKYLIEHLLITKNSAGCT